MRSRVLISGRGVMQKGQDCQDSVGREGGGCSTSFCCFCCCCYFFFFQAEDGIRDIGVTGVQTCALPILVRRSPMSLQISTAPLMYMSATTAAFPSFEGLQSTLPLTWMEKRQQSLSVA